MKIPISLITISFLLITSVYGQDVTSSTDAVFNFVVTSKSGVPREGELIILKSKKTKKSFSEKTSAEGKGTLTIPSGDTYTVFYKHLADTVKYKDIDVPGGDHRMTYTFTLKYDPPKVFTLKNVFFETGSAALKKESFPALNELTEALKSKPKIKIEIAGHTDDVGSDESNMKLSSDRAASVRQYLISHGIDGNRVTSKGYGETQPVASNETAEGRQLNRRTEVRIVEE